MLHDLFAALHCMPGAKPAREKADNSSAASPHSSPRTSGRDPLAAPLELLRLDLRCCYSTLSHMRLYKAHMGPSLLPPPQPIPGLAAHAGDIGKVELGITPTVG
eukprot:6492589-Amphidinium_carterae.1